MSKKEKEKHKEAEHDEEEINESWLLPYSDLMTLLLALFIVLFSISAVDSQKLEKMSEVFSEIFSGGTGFLEESAARETDQKLRDEKKEMPHVFSAEEQNTLQEIQERINQYIITKGLTDQLNVTLTPEGLLVTISGSVLFDSGSAEVRTEDVEFAKEISDLLVMDPPSNVIISGHTDNVPIHNSKYASNWELSVMRAVNFMRIILENPNLDPSRFSAKGFGEYNPIASNDTEEGRAKNRRVEVLILPNDETVE